MNKKIASEIAIGVIFLVAIIVGGAFYWQNKKGNQQQTKPDENQQQKDSQSYIEIKDSQSYIEIKEMGIKIPVDPAMAQDLVYRTDIMGDANFSSKTLNAASRYCGGGASGPTISMIPETPNSFKNTNPTYYKAHLSDIKQFDDFFLFYQEPQASCTIGKNVDLEKKVAQAIRDGFKNASLIDEQYKFNEDLKNAAFSAICKKGIENKNPLDSTGWFYTCYDKKIDILKIDDSQKAAIGQFYQKDAWHWIAWMQDDGTWKVLPSFEGFNCKDLESVPSQYSNLFKNEIYPSGQKYCH